MEARRAFVGSRSYRQLWIMLAALFCAAIVGAGAALITGGTASSGAAKPSVVVQPGTGPAPVNSNGNHKQTVF